MRLDYFPDTDTLYIQLKGVPGVDAQEVSEDIVFDLNAAGEVIGIEIEHASQHMELNSFQISSLPVADIASQAG
jgi:uncharacterized protein YuzE